MASHLARYVRLAPSRNWRVRLALMSVKLVSSLRRSPVSALRVQSVQRPKTRGRLSATRVAKANIRKIGDSQFVWAAKRALFLRTRVLIPAHPAQR